MANKIKFILDYYKYIDNVEKLSYTEDNIIFNEIKKQSKFGYLAILEGLIITHPLSKSSNIIRKRFPELDVEVENDGEIYIEGKFDVLKKYLPIFTNLGYFISILTIDGTKWLKNYTEKTVPIALYLEPKYDFKIENIPNILYHTSPLKFKNKISKIGLSPRTGSKLANHPDRIYLTDSIVNANNFGLYLKRENNTFYDDGFCIYSVNGKSIIDLYSDINFREGGYYTLQNIKPLYIKSEKEIIF